MRYIGFTGTRSGMSHKQAVNLFKALAVEAKSDEITGVHGGCIGADIQFHKMCKLLGFKVEVFPGHPKGKPDDDSMMGDFSDADVIHPSNSYFARNRSIVDKVNVMYATPYNTEEGPGGTWYTIKYSRGKVDELTILSR